MSWSFSVTRNNAAEVLEAFNDEVGKQPNVPQSVKPRLRGAALELAKAFLPPDVVTAASSGFIDVHKRNSYASVSIYTRDDAS